MYQEKDVKTKETYTNNNEMIAKTGYLIKFPIVKRSTGLSEVILNTLLDTHVSPCSSFNVNR